MCGIVGILGGNRLLGSRLDSCLEKMTDKLESRGPDGRGIWIDRENDLGFGHRRLSIIDLSESGSQPMISPCQRYVITYNGEIYNAKELREELLELNPDIKFCGTSDTEVLLYSYIYFGKENFLDKLDGMFAFAIFDKKQKSLFLARDPIGEKPLYYGIFPDFFFFSSDLSVVDILRNYYSFSLSETGITSFLEYACICKENSIYQNVYKLLPGNYLEFSLEEFSSKREISQKKYWFLEEEYKNIQNFSSENESLLKFEELLETSIKRRLRSDVPVGAFLSGGIDSSIVVSLLSKMNVDITTFTVGFENREFDEAPYARKIAQHLGVKHVECQLSPKKALEVVPKLSSIYSEPFADSSAIPTYLISEEARKHVKVILSGDGGDELFFGYGRYYFARKLWKSFSKVPFGIRNLLGKVLINSPEIRRLILFFDSQALYRLGSFLNGQTAQKFYHCILKQWNNIENILKNKSLDKSLDKDLFSNNFDFAMMRTDIGRYLPDDILTKVDRASMGVGLEARVPFLSKDIISFANSLPLNIRAHEKVPKYFLKKLLEKYVPPKLYERKKMGFGVPLADWLRGDLKGWAEELLTEKELSKTNIFSPKEVQKFWNFHKKGQGNFHYELWPILCLQAWLREKKLSLS